MQRSCPEEVTNSKRKERPARGKNDPVDIKERRSEQIRGKEGID
jgi:hypothetical protein